MIEQEIIYYLQTEIQNTDHNLIEIHSDGNRDNFHHVIEHK